MGVQRITIISKVDGFITAAIILVNVPGKKNLLCGPPLITI